MPGRPLDRLRLLRLVSACLAAMELVLDRRRQQLVLDNRHAEHRIELLAPLPNTLRFPNPPKFSPNFNLNH